MIARAKKKVKANMIKSLAILGVGFLFELIFVNKFRSAGNASSFNEYFFQFI